MKKCPACGREYPDEVSVCPQDGQPLAPPPPPSGPAAFAQQPQPPSSGLAITSMVLGIVSVIMCGPFSGIPAVICGHIALDRSKKLPLQYRGGGMAIAGLVTGYIGCTIMCLAFTAGLLLPALAAAKKKAVQIQCVNNLKQVGLAVRIWAGDHNGMLPQSFMDMTNELGNPRILICPADPDHKIPSSGTPFVWDPTNITYEFVAPGMAISALSNQVIIRCPIHGTELYADGSVHFVNRRAPPN
jgi:hypothetical protein